MSKSKLLSLAVAAALVAPSAFATTLTSTTSVLPRNAFVDGTINAQNGTALTVLADANSVYLGRTTGYNIKLTLDKGLFNGNPTATPVDAAGGSGGALPSSVSLAGGGDNSTVATFAVTPDTVDGVRQGDGLSFAINAITVDNLAALGTAGTLGLTVQVFDPVGGNQLGPTLNTTLVQTVEGWVISYVAPADATFGASQRIDVGSNSAKKLFSHNGVVNSTSSPAIASDRLFSAGKITVATNPALTNVMTLDPAVATVSLTVTGANFAPFLAANTGSVFLSTNAVTNCSAVGTALAVAAGNLSASSTTSTATNTNNASVCFNSDNATAIAAQSLGASAIVKQAGLLDSAAVTEGTQFLDMAFNGIVKTVSSFNPSSNASVDSLLRVINTSSTSGLFTIDGTCPDGTALTKATFTLAGGNNAVQYNSAELQTGTVGVGKPALSAALGTCPTTGRLRLTVTGEVGTAEVQNFLRANTSVGQITSGHNNEN